MSLIDQHEKFAINDLAGLMAKLAELNLDIPLSEDFSVLGRPVKLGADRTCPNTFVVQPMEGFDSDASGTPGELSFRRYRRYAEGGAGLIWFEATAVMDEARTNPGQFYLHSGNVEVFEKLVEETREAARKACGHEIITILQITHSGRYSKPGGVPRPIIAHHNPILDPRHNLPEDYPLVTDDYLDALQNRFVEVAKLAEKAGFDGVDIKCCHHYLFSELLASHTREGKYGGSYENRTRMLKDTIAKVQGVLDKAFVTTRMNAYDAISYPYGWGVDKDDYRVSNLEEPKRLVKDLAGMGLPLINLSIGNPYFNPNYNRPYNQALIGFEPAADHPLYGVARFLGVVRDIQQAVPETPVIASGMAWLRQFMPYAAAGMIENKWATLIGQGRGSFAYPDSVRDILENGGMDPKKVCTTCSKCTQMMRDGVSTGCLVRDAGIYAEQFKLGRKKTGEKSH